MPIRRWTMIFLAVLLLGMLAACGENATDEEVGEFKGVPEVAVSGGGGSSPNDITIDTDGANLKFDKATLEATTGKIKVTFNNKAGAGLLHNWVLVKPGDEDKAVSEATANAPAYVPTATFVGHTETIDGGKSSTAEFEVAEAGTYTYLCTFPGHYGAGMKGTMTVAAGSGGAATGGGESGGAAGGLEFSTDGANLKFDKATAEAAAGEITVKFSNAATPGLLHNWVLVKPGEEDAAVAEAVAPDYVPTKTFVGHTKTINGGEADSATFTVEPGTYTYLCTFPGHYLAGMKGTLTVK